MNLSKNKNFALRVSAVFSATFLIVFITIFLTQSPYSSPPSYSSLIKGMDIAVGPIPNSTNVPLDTAITVEALASTSLNDLLATPNVSFASVSSDTTGPLTYRTSFYPTKLLSPETTYNISVTIMKVHVSWSFTTTSQPFQPRTSYYLATNDWWIAFATATVSTAISILIMKLRSKMF
jgi:hypothetical protein